MVCKVTPATPIYGYKASKEVNEKKLIRNVKKQGDIYFSTGDLLSCDKNGYIYFVDRLGDTFRYYFLFKVLFTLFDIILFLSNQDDIFHYMEPS